MSYRSVLHVNLVADDNEGEVLGVSGACLDEELVSPAVERLECVAHRHVVHQHAAVGTAIERNPQRLETLLAGCIPNLQTHEAIEQSQKVRTYSEK